MLARIVFILFMLLTLPAGADQLCGPSSSCAIPSGSVDTEQIAQNAVSAVEIANNAVPIQKIRDSLFHMTFCGLGPNATAESFFSPISGIISDGVDWSIGATACDANSGTTIDSQDEVEAGSGQFVRIVKWMHCTFVDSASKDDLITFAFYDEEVSKMTCTIQLDGTAETKACTSSISAGETIAANGEITVGLIAVDDDLSAAGQDAWCRIGGVLDL